MDARRTDGELSVATSVGGTTTGTGVLRSAPNASRRPGDTSAGTRSRGWTITEADVELFADWIGGGNGAGDPVPWPLLILLTSGLLGRDRLFAGKTVDQVLNRWMRWRFESMPTTGETVQCDLRSHTSRPSRTRAGYQVSRIVLDTRSADDGRSLTEIDWVVLTR
ncbi:hypothetical protein [Actinomadura madurae]|uniref:hypothetical protein n=1 Tax=Actinomadura madurae TaxID=1993 RepID=UPI0020D23361|nr:hypothetical protein [Actinomadura madurae]MCQ0016327.1 hypothetical protein [Actinomadura madurae]